MSDHAGKFVWYDVMTTDTKAAEAFYRDVVGWKAADSGMSDRPYTIFSAGEVPVGGLMPIPAEARAMGAQPHWSGYIAVDDVDAYASRVTAAGGTVHKAPEDIPGVGRFAVVADPHGAGFILFKGAGEPPPAAAAPGTPGTAGWHELHGGDQPSDFAFYSGLFGWTKADAMDMGAMGVYQLFAAGGMPVGGMMTKMPGTPAPHWLYYFNVDAIDAAAARVRQRGGQVVLEPTEVPGGSWIIQCVDPQGARFALVAPRR
ncbi:MAG: VOC family protein [Alphaproteobacteria bacterium]|nr:VOC family protein [Alphaproteobacteria bacterium]